MTPSLANTYVITVLFCVVTTRGGGYVDKRLLLHAGTDLVELVQTMKTEIDTLSSIVRSMSDTLNSLSNTVYNLTATNQAQEEKIKALEAGSYNLPAFMAALSVDLLHCSSNQHVVFDNVILNVGDGYNPLHGVFRAPVSGTYQFSLTLSEPTNVGHYHVVIRKGKSATVIGYLYTDPTTIWVLRTISVLTQLAVGEDVWVACSLDETYIVGGTDEIRKYHSHFSGFLVSH
ncbi:hypothetical protein ACJMK2_010415 [Sinanodonta woodiana]|uniref:C1q domain-containing protein n=1 Tax=Sinanodonta woodiana TaxID=1069815 RepID=A0ABD3VI93_SINWO